MAKFGVYADNELVFMFDSYKDAFSFAINYYYRNEKDVTVKTSTDTVLNNWIYY